MAVKYDKEKARWARILRVYGLTKDEYSILDLGYCPLCRRPWSAKVRPVVDHDHVTGFVRGVLCSYDNHRVLGRNRDVDKLERMVSYLKNQPMKTKVPIKKKTRKRRKRK